VVKSFGDKNLQFVEENVNNGEFYRYYEISPVANRNLLRVTLYGKVSTFAFRSRGKNTIRSLDRMLTYIQQSDRKAPAHKKPIDEEELATAISKFANQFQVNSVSNLDFEAIKRMLVNPISKEYRKRFSVKIGQQIKVIDVAEIECLYSENKGTYIHTLDNRDYLIDSSLEVVEAELDPKDFFRISRKYIIPLQSVKEIQLYSNSRLKISLPTYKADEVIVSRERVSDFKEWLG
jgi:hypothetical protein